MNGLSGGVSYNDRYRKSLLLLEYLERKENVFSFEKQWKIEKIKKLAEHPPEEEADGKT